MGRYVVWQPEAGQAEADGVKVSAGNTKAAAEEWADHDDYRSNEFHIVGGQPATVMVRDLDSGKAHEWIVSGESVRHYTARLRIPLARGHEPVDGGPSAGDAGACAVAARPLGATGD